MNLTKRELITDDLELREYDMLAKLCSDLTAPQASPSHRFSAGLLVWQRQDACRRMAEMADPPKQLLIDPTICAWPEIREKCRKAAEAYDEMFAEFERAYRNR